MSVTLYSTGCPNCRTLEKLLSKANVEYEKRTDRDEMLDLGFMSIPILKVGDEFLVYKKAIDWVNSLEEFNEKQ